MSTNSQAIQRVHNYGIYMKKGKRSIFQIDFPGKTFYIIQRGHIKRNFTFESLRHYDSEEGLHVVVKFSDCDIEFDTDNSEEKYTVCRLLSLILDGPATYANTPLSLTGPSVPLLPPVKIRQERELKDGILEKKGNTTITTWNKRRVKVSAGEFSYFKPGEDLALNIIQIWDGICTVKRVGSNGFSVTIRDERTYSFRCIADTKMKVTAEDDREDWIKVFQKAIQTRRSTLVYLDSTKSSANSNPENLYSMASDINNSTEVPMIKSIQSTDTQQQFSQYQQRPQEITAHLSVSVSYGDASKSPSTLVHQNQKFTYLTENPTSTTLKSQQANPDTDSKLQDEEEESTETTVSSARAKFEERIKEHADADNTDVKRNWASSPRTSVGETRNEPAPESSAMNDIPTPLVAPPPPPPLLNVKKSGVKLTVQPSVKLKPAHWNKITNPPATSIWKTMHDVTKNLDLSLLEDQFSLKDKDNIENKEGGTRKSKELLLDPKRAHILGIIVNGMKISGNMNILDFLSRMTESQTFPSETLSTIRSCQPTDDDKEMYKAFKGPEEKLMAVDRFMKSLCEIPYIGLRLELSQTVWEFPRTYEAVQEEVESIWMACEELTNSTNFVKVLEYILAIGNQLNAKWSSGYGAVGFEITSIDKILDVKGNHSSVTVLGYLVEVLSKRDPSVLKWTESLKHVHVAAEYSVKAVGAEIEVLKNDILKVKKNMKVLKPLMTSNQDKQFFIDLQQFILENERGLAKLDARAIQIVNKYNKTLELFGEKAERASDVFFSSIGRFSDKFQQACEKSMKEHAKM